MILSILLDKQLQIITAEDVLQIRYEKLSELYWLSVLSRGSESRWEKLNKRK